MDLSDVPTLVQLEVQLSVSSHGDHPAQVVVGRIVLLSVASDVASGPRSSPLATVIDRTA